MSKRTTFIAILMFLLLLTSCKQNTHSTIKAYELQTVQSATISTPSENPDLINLSGKEIASLITAFNAAYDTIQEGQVFPSSPPALIINVRVSNKKRVTIIDIGHAKQFRVAFSEGDVNREYSTDYSIESVGLRGIFDVLAEKSSLK
ncbi:MAG: hypothetical protein SCK29_01805 [Bacillota bacterium]|nr:hypothetical protein [Bacillota bacterium]MDW7682836.1 hypothetical protein [Bacillota bacterium]